jgi:hypothetical protein
MIGQKLTRLDRLIVTKDKCSLSKMEDLNWDFLRFQHVRGFILDAGDLVTQSAGSLREDIHAPTKNCPCARRNISG